MFRDRPSLVCCILVCVLLVSDRAPGEGDGPVRVFILAGQSNMQGKAKVETGHGDVSGAIGSLRYLADTDPANYGHLVNPDGTWATRSDVWIHYNTENSSGTVVTVSGSLTAGYGNLGNVTSSDPMLGPELGFGNVMGDFFGEPVLLIKEAWGGKSLAVDLRPPSAGGVTGEYYTRILNDVEDVLNDLSTYVPGYHGQGYRIEGLAWHQGWNDRVNQGYNDEYEQNLVTFIQDIRSDLGVPELPFVVASTGMSGWNETHPRALSLMAAQAAIVDADKYPEFVGNVGFVETRDFWRDSDVSPANQAYHWNQNSETLYLIGKGLGDEMALLVPEPTSCLLLLGGAFALLRRRRRRP